MAPIQFPVSMENNNSENCESTMSKKSSSSFVQNSQCQQAFTKTSEHMSNSKQMSKSELMSKSANSSHPSACNSEGDMNSSLLSDSISSLQSINNDKIYAIHNLNSPKAIQKRGNFFEDSFFADVRENFQKAVSEVLEKCGENSSLCDNMTSYRKMRQLDLKDENQAGTISHGEKEYKIVLDVQDFKRDDIKVKIIENNTIEITGYVEKTTGNSVSTQNFHRQFTLPGIVDMALVTSSMSSDGILTIIVPRVENKQMLNTQQHTSFDSALNKNKENYQCSNNNEKANCIKSTKSKDSTTSVTTKTSAVTSQTSATSQANHTKSTVEAQSSPSLDSNSSYIYLDKNSPDKSMKQQKQITIAKRGNFFEDSFFADAQNDFQKAVSEVLEKCGEKSSSYDDMSSYRNLRQRTLTEKNQAATVSYGEKEHKIVLDVYDFKQSDIKVQIMEDNSIQISGHMEKKNGKTISIQSFNKQFTLPGPVDMEKVSSSMSSDGVLTVVIPRLVTNQTISNNKKDNQLCNETNLNKESNQRSVENPIASGKSMQSKETEASCISQETGIKSVIEGTLSSSHIDSVDIGTSFNSATNDCTNEKSTEDKSIKIIEAEKSRPTLISQESDTKSGTETNLSSSISNTKDSSSEANSKCRTNNNQPVLTIKKRGNFFEDSFFADVHENFKRAIMGVLEMSGESSSLSDNLSDNMTSYRSLRQRDLKEENQAATVLHGEKEHKIVIDVHDFKKDDIKVQIIEDNTVKITGHMEKKSGSSISTQSFHRQFTLPGTVDVSLVTSSISSDGILTVVMPRLPNKQIISNTKEENISDESRVKKENSQSSHVNTKISGEIMKKMNAGETNSSMISPSFNIDSGSRADLSSSNCNAANVCFEDKDSNINKERNDSSIGNTTTKKRSTKESKLENSELSSISQDFHTKSSEVNKTLSPANSNSTEIWSKDKDTQGMNIGQPEPVAVKKGGNFFDDSFFADVHENFQNAINEVLEKYEGTSSVGDSMSCYRNLRKQNLKEENQAAAVTYGEKEHKIVLDVNDFKDGDIKVKMIEENTVQITGHIERKNGSAISEQNFHRQFTLPGPVDMELVSSFISSDGILTVIIPIISTKQLIPNHKKYDNICKESNLNKESNQLSKEKRIATNKSLETTKDEQTKSYMNSQTSLKLSNTADVMNNSKSSEISQTSFTTNGKEAQTDSSNDNILHVVSGDGNEKVNCEIIKNVVKNDEGRKNEKVKSSLDLKECDKKLDTKLHSLNFNEKTPIDNTAKINQNVSSIIKKKGKFFEDSLFENVHENFRKAVSDIVSKCGGSSSLCDIMEAYRNLRKQHFQEENRAVTVSCGEKEHKIILDVHDFTKDDVQIQVVENTIKVTGHIENKNGNAISTQSFHRQFTLPGTVDTNSVTSSMSSDSILTITVPVVNCQFTKSNHNLLKNMKNSGETSSTTNETQSSENVHNISKFSKQATNHNIKQTSSYSSSQKNSSNLESNQTPSCVNSINKNAETLDFNLPIRKRGQFFQDSFFNESQKQFDEAMKSILHEFGNTNNIIDTTQSYRNLRQKELKEEQQACSMIQDSQQHKIVIDVHEFMEGNINVKVVGETEIVVEGKNKQQKGVSLSSQRFNRSFVLSNKIDASSVQSSLSSDGILTITVPKI